jgi:hypothetical protein
MEQETTPRLLPELIELIAPNMQDRLNLRTCSRDWRDDCGSIEEISTRNRLKQKRESDSWWKRAEKRRPQWRPKSLCPEAPNGGYIEIHQCVMTTEVSVIDERGVLYAYSQDHYGSESWTGSDTDFQGDRVRLEQWYDGEDGTLSISLVIDGTYKHISGGFKIGQYVIGGNPLCIPLFHDPQGAAYISANVDEQRDWNMAADMKTINDDLEPIRQVVSRYFTEFLD